MTTNRQWLLRQRPSGMVGPEHFELAESPLPEPDLGAGEVLLKTRMLGFDPAMRGWLIDEPSYLPPVAIGEVMRASSVGEVVASENPDLPVGTLVQGMSGWQEYAVAGPGSFIPPQPLPTSPDLKDELVRATYMKRLVPLGDRDFECLKIPGSRDHRTRSTSR